MFIEQKFADETWVNVTHIIYIELYNLFEPTKGLIKWY
jgi:hypothetical protein